MPHLLRATLPPSCRWVTVGFLKVLGTSTLLADIPEATRRALATFQVSQPKAAFSCVVLWEARGPGAHAWPLLRHFDLPTSRQGVQICL